MLPEPDELRRIARTLLALADSLEKQTADNDDQLSFSDRYTPLSEAVEHVEHLVGRGVTEFDAAVRAASKHRLDYTTVLGSLRESDRKRPSRELHAKRMMVAYLTKRGWTNDKIADAIGVHEKHIPRMRRALGPD